jgi:hypothetical protein
MVRRVAKQFGTTRNIYATRRQKQLYEQAEAAGGAHRRGVRETRGVEENREGTRLGDGEQVDGRRKEKWFRSREEGQQKFCAEGRTERRTERSEAQSGRREEKKSIVAKELSRFRI